MRNSIAQLFQALPATVLATGVVFLLCLLVGWISSIAAGFRSVHGQGLRLLLIFPLSNPFALLLLWYRSRKVDWVPLVAYVVAVISLPLGGFLSERVEKHRLERHVAALEQAGESVAVASLISEAVPADENVWSHPFLEPLARAARHGAEGEPARASLDERYQALSMPQHRPRIRYADEEETGRTSRDVPYWDPFRAFHRNAVSTDAGQELIKNLQAPGSWEECGDLLLNHFEPADEDFAALSEALARTREQYPHAWEKGFDLLLPHLAKLKAFTQCATWRSMAWNSRGEPEAAYRDLRTALRLLEIGDSDLLISRLVQWAQSAITLNAVMAAQQYHAWNGDQWATLQAELEAIDFPSQVADSMRAERVCGHATISPLLRQSPLELRRSLDQLGTAPAERGWEQTGLRRGADLLTNLAIGGLSRAVLLRQWRLALEAYQDFIVAIEAAVQRSHSEAWKDLHVAELPRPMVEYGLFAEMLMPALDKAFAKSIDIQTNLRLAGVACALERYFLAHDRYPNSLDELSPEYLAEPTLDPMTRQAWPYERTGERSFRLYSVGRNGIDESGLYTRGGSPGSGSRKDDLAWVVTEQLPPLPEIAVDPPSVQLEDGLNMPAEMMRRYGLAPPDKVAAPPPTGPSDAQ